MIPEIKEADKVLKELDGASYKRAEMLRTNLEKCTSSITDVSIQGGSKLHSREDALLLLAEMTSMLDNSKEKRVLEAYLELAGLYNWDVIDCIAYNKEKTIEEIHKEIIELLKNKGII